MCDEGNFYRNRVSIRFLLLISARQVPRAIAAGFVESVKCPPSVFYPRWSRPWPRGLVPTLCRRASFRRRDPRLMSPALPRRLCAGGAAPLLTVVAIILFCFRGIRASAFCIIMCRHARFLNLAAVEAKESPLDTKHGSLLVRGGKVIGSGHNSSRSRLQSIPGESNVTSLHSEMAAAKAVPWLLQGSSAPPGARFPRSARVQATAAPL